MWHSCSTETNRRSGLTLLELVVSLAILAVLSTIAVQALDPLADQARYEATRRTLADVRAATVGRYAQGMGGTWAAGYLADVGVMPTAIDDLLVQPVGLAAHTSYTFDSDRDGNVDVLLHSGWRGPYLLLGAGETTIVDGWGNPLLIDPDGGVFDYLSRGADNDSVLPEDDYAADLSVEIPTRETTASLTCRLFEIDTVLGTRIDPSPAAGQQLGVMLYRVNGAGGTSGAIEEQILPIASTGTFDVLLATVLHGPIAARGVMWNDTDADQVFDVGETLVLSSFIHYVTIVGGTDQRVEMDLR